MKGFAKKCTILVLLCFMLASIVLYAVLTQFKQVLAKNMVDVATTTELFVDSGSSLEYITNYPHLAAYTSESTYIGAANPADTVAKATTANSQAGKGAYAQLKEGDALQTGVLDMSARTTVYPPPNVGSTSDLQEALGIMFVPSKGFGVGAAPDNHDAKSFNIEFFDGVNSVIFKLERTSDTVGAAAANDMRVSTNGSAYTSLESASFYHMLGWHTGGYFSWDRHVLRIYINNSSKVVRIAGGTSNYKDSSLPGSFDLTKTTVKMWFEGYTSGVTSAGLNVYALNGSAVSEFASINTASKLQTEFIKGQQVTMPDASLAVGGATYPAAKTITDVFGNDKANGFTAADAGKYTVKYSYTKDGTDYYKNYTINVLTDVFGGISDAATYGSFPFDPSMSYGNGVLAAVKKDEVLNISKAIDLTNMNVGFYNPTLADFADTDQAPKANRWPITSLYFIPSAGYQGGNSYVDFGQMFIKFTGIDDPSQSFTIRLYDKDPTGNHSYYYQIVDINGTTQNGAELTKFTQPNGYNNANARDNSLGCRIFFDYATKNIFVGDNSANNPGFLGTASGFTAQSVTTSIWFENYYSDSIPVSFMVKRLGNEFLTSQNGLDIIKPEITVNSDFLQVDKGTEVTVFNAVATDSGSPNVVLTSNVFFDYSGAKTQISVNNNKFIATQIGEYTIEYTAKDFAGNVAVTTALIDVIAAEFKLDAVYDSDEGELTVTTQGAAAHSYQYWIYTKVNTGLADNNPTWQYIWQPVGSGAFSANPSATFTVDQNCLNPQGKYVVLVRIKFADGTLKTLNGWFSKADLNLPEINGVVIDGKEGDAAYVIEDGSNFVIQAKNALSYEIDSGVADKSIITSNSAAITLDLSDYESGYYDFKVTAKGANNASDSIIVKVFIAAAFDPAQVPEVLSLTGDTIQDGDYKGETQFIMTASTVAKGNISATEVTDGTYTAKLTVDGRAYYSYSADNNGANGTLRIIFDNIQLNGKGIREVKGYINRATVSSADDFILIYYYGYIAGGNVSIQAENYTGGAAAGTDITLRAYNADVGGNTENLEYAFYREDASGWICVRGYNPSPTFDWKPARAGTYYIQVRVKDDSFGGTWEAAATSTLIIGDSLSGSLTASVEELSNGYVMSYDEYSAGTAYIVKADYQGDAQVLYMFTLYNAKQGTTYLTKYSINGEYTFMLNKADDYILTVRVIGIDRYGALDLVQPIQIKTNI